MALLSIQQLSYQWPGQQGPLFTVPQLTLEQGESLFIEGASGSGKSTLLNLMAGVLTPTSGSIHLLQQPFSSQKGRYRDRIRADHIGFIFQQFNLIPYLSVIRNVLLPCRLSAKRRQRALAQHTGLEEAAEHWLERLHIPRSTWYGPVLSLSVGQQQRVAAARALIGAPELIIADEPTSALDQDNVDNFMTILTDQCRAINSTLIFVSHDRHLAKGFERTLTLPSKAVESNNGFGEVSL